MLILASTADHLQINVQSPGFIDVHASWMDNVAGAVGPGRTNTPTITTATTVDVVGPPASGSQRNVKTVNVRNRGAGTNQVAIVHIAGGTGVNIYSVQLPAGYTLQYLDGVGFLPVAPGIQ